MSNQDRAANPNAPSIRIGRRPFLKAITAAGCMAISGCSLSRKPSPKQARPHLMLAACGLNCNICDSKPEKCSGCHSTDGKLWSADCRIRQCCILDKKLDDCSQCDSFPCELIVAFENDRWPHHTAAVKTLRQRRGE